MIKNHFYYSSRKNDYAVTQADDARGLVFMVSITISLSLAKSASFGGTPVAQRPYQSRQFVRTSHGRQPVDSWFR